MRKAKPFLVVGAFWIALFLFVIAGYSGDLGFGGITGYAILESGEATPMGLQSLAVLILLFTNMATMFFLIREKANK